MSANPNHPAYVAQRNDRGIYRKGERYMLTIPVEVVSDRAGGLLQLRTADGARLDVYPNEVVHTPGWPTPAPKLAVTREEPMRASMDHTPGGMIDERPSRGGL